MKDEGWTWGQVQKRAQERQHWKTLATALWVSGCQRRKRDTDAGEQQCYCKEDEDEDEDKRPPGSGEEEEQPPVSRAPGHDVLAAICVPVAVITAVIAVIFAVVVVKRKRSPEAMERTKRYGPVELKDKNESPDQQQ